MRCLLHVPEPTRDLNLTLLYSHHLHVSKLPAIDFSVFVCQKHLLTIEITNLITFTLYYIYRYS